MHDRVYRPGRKGWAWMLQDSMGHDSGVGPASRSQSRSGVPVGSVHVAPHRCLPTEVQVSDAGCYRMGFSALSSTYFRPHMGGGSPVSHLPALASLPEPRLGSCRVVASCRAPTAASELTWVWMRRPPGLADFVGVNTLRLVSRRLRDC